MRTGILFLLCFLLGSGAALAETRYVSDELVVMLRQGQGDKYKILKMVKAGTPLEVLEEHDEYLHARHPDGTEGYVLKQYITRETPKGIVIARLEKERERLQGRLRELEGKLNDVQAQAATANQSRAAGEGMLAEREKELAEVRRKYEDLQEKSRNVVELSAERDRLQTQSEQLTAEVGTLRKENEQMLYASAIKWFLAGGGVFLVGWMIGKTSRKKKKGYSF